MANDVTRVFAQINTNKSTSATKAGRMVSRTVFRAGSNGRRHRLHRFPNAVLPKIVGISSLLFIALLSVVLLNDRLFLYSILAVGGLIGIYFVNARSAVKEGETGLNLGDISMERALFLLVRVAVARGQEEAAHCERVATNAVAIGRELGLPQSELETLWWAGMLHDIGKIGTSKSLLLQKAVPLTEQEWQEVQKRSEYGAEIVAEFCGSSTPVVDAIRFQHERWDGKGFRSRLRGEQIPLFSRIVAIANTFEALTGSRADYSGITPAQAFVYLRSEAGRHFDSTLVSVFDRLFREGAICAAGAMGNNKTENLTTLNC